MPKLIENEVVVEVTYIACPFIANAVVASVGVIITDGAVVYAFPKVTFSCAPVE